MRGYDKKDPGLIPLSIRQVFDYINQDKQRSYQVAVSYLEVSIASNPLKINHVFRYTMKASTT